MFIKNVTSKYFFQQKKYLPIGNIVEQDSAEYITRKYVSKALEDTENKLNDVQCTASKAWYSSPEGEYLLLNTLPRLEYLLGMNLQPTYSYMRVYLPGEVLEKHIDRPACEITVSINLGQSSNYNWPIWIQDPKDITNISPIETPPLHGLIFRGQEVPHWRDAFATENPNDWQCQIFLHYVDSFGPCQNEIYDNRRGFEITQCGQNADYKLLDIPYEVV